MISKLASPAHTLSKLNVKEKNIFAYIENHPGTQSGAMAISLNLALPTLKRILAVMVEKKIIVKHGQGAGTHYSVEN